MTTSDEAESAAATLRARGWAIYQALGEESIITIRHGRKNLVEIGAGQYVAVQRNEWDEWDATHDPAYSFVVFPPFSPIYVMTSRDWGTVKKTLKCAAQQIPHGAGGVDEPVQKNPDVPPRPLPSKEDCDAMFKEIRRPVKVHKKDNY